MAAPSALTGEVRQRIVENLSSGCSLEVAAQAAGVTDRTVYAWLAIGREAAELREAGVKLTQRQQSCLGLLDAERTARAQVRVQALSAIQRAADEGTWQAGAWLLERLFPEEFAAIKRTNGGAGGRPKGSSSAPDRAAKKPKLRVVGE